MTDEHPTQAVTPGAAATDPGEGPDAELVDPSKAAKGEFEPVLDEAAELRDSGRDPSGD